MVQPRIFSSPVRNIILTKKEIDEIWIQTTCKNSGKIDWLADTGSPHSFINPTTANKIMMQNPNVKIENLNENKYYRCFNNKEIKIKGVIPIDITSGSWCAKRCPILIVEQNTTKLMGRDVLPKLGISLQQTKQPDKTKLKQPVLPQGNLWDFDHDSEPELNIQYKYDEPTQDSIPRALSPDTSDSENAPLRSPKRVPEEQATRAALTQPDCPNPVNRETLGIQKYSRLPTQTKRNRQNN